MSTSLRTWLAGGLLAFSALTLTLPSGAESIADRAALLLLVVFAHAWVVAVGERACEGHGGLRLRRFPLGPRLLAVRPGLFPQLFVLVVLLGVATWSLTAGAVAFGVLVVTSTDSVRRRLAVIGPIVLLFHALATTPAFESFSDLLAVAGDWVQSLAGWALVGVVFAGPLLRTDVSGRLPPAARVLAMLAALPGYGAAAWLFTRTPLAGRYPDLLAVAAVLLAGGLLQSLVLALLGRTMSIRERDPQTVSALDACSLGRALFPLLVPLLAFMALAVFAPGESFTRLAPAAGWAGLMALCMVVPAVPAAAFVAGTLDRLDGVRRSLAGTLLAVGALLAWMVMGPQLLGAFYAVGGPASELAQHFFGRTPAWVSRVAPDGTVQLAGLPLDDLCRSVTLMVLSCAVLSARYLRYARPQRVSAGWGKLFLLLMVQAGATAGLVGWMGPTGAPLAAAIACTLMLLADLARGPSLVEHSQPGRPAAAGLPR